MEHSSLVDLSGWRALAIQIGLVAVGALSFVILFSFGGQLVAAPGLLPVQWLLARNTDGWVARAFAILGSLLVLEVVFLAVALAIGDGVVAVGTGFVLGLAGASVFFVTAERS